MELIPPSVRAPEIGQVWFNSEPLTLRGLRGDVVLIDFWDYTCLNCLRTLPYVRAWHEKYRSLGLRVIGVHTPEFSFSRHRPYIERAVKELGIDYPVVLDNEFAIWNAFANKCWPAKYVIDPNGFVRFFALGEGHYHDTEEAVQLLLAMRNSSVKLPPFTPLVRAMDDPRVIEACRRPTPELYCGSARGRVANPSGFEDNKLTEFAYGAELPPAATLELDGWWGVSRECLQVGASPRDARESRIRLRMEAAEANLVMHPPEDGIGEIDIRLDGQFLRSIRVDRPGMYNLVPEGRFRECVLEVSSGTQGLEIYAFTFVGCIQEKAEERLQ